MSASPSPEVDPTDETPLSIEPVLGWRVWRLTREGGELRLQAVSHLSTWMPQEATAAQCSFTSHRAPLESCTCGYYAASSMENLVTSGVFVRGVGVIGAIAMWGTVIEHARGARSEFAYPARLRLVCSQCLQAGSIVDPLTVVEDTWLVPLCDRHWRSRGDGHRDASAVQSELLSTYGVEVLPRPRLPSSPRLRKQLTPADIAKSIVLGVFHVLRFLIGVIFALWCFSGILFAAAVVIGDVVQAVAGPGAPSPTAVVSAPGPLLADAYRVFGPHRDAPPRPAPPRLAIKCGISHWSWIEFAPCSSSGWELLGFAAGTEPRGVARDCPSPADAYSYGKDWNVCWSAMPGT